MDWGWFLSGKEMYKDYCNEVTALSENIGLYSWVGKMTSLHPHLLIMALAIHLLAHVDPTVWGSLWTFSYRIGDVEIYTN